jgi:hypothetical protein
MCEGEIMAEQNKNEVYELLHRAGQLAPGEQLYLAETILARLRDALFTDHEAIKRELAEVEAWHLAQQRLKGLSGEAKSEAG